MNPFTGSTGQVHGQPTTPTLTIPAGEDVPERLGAAQQGVDRQTCGRWWGP